MKAENLRTKTDAELNKKLADLKAELFNLRFSNATGSLANPKALEVCKKEIARVMTIVRERELGISGKVAKLETEKAVTKKETKKTASKKA